MRDRLTKVIPCIVAMIGAATSQAQNPAGFALYADRLPTEAEAKANYTGAKHEPRYGCYAGAFIDLDDTLLQTFKDSTGKVRRLPEQFEELTGKPHATYFYYMGYGRPAATDWITKLGLENRIVHIALEPNNGLPAVKDDAYLLNLAKQLGSTQTPIFLRFASEMNGPWTKYNGNAKLYIEKFRLIAKKMHEYAPNVAMVWCPYATPVNNIPSYYPGDEHVDWVGVNIYSVTYYDQDPKQPGKNDLPINKLTYIYNKFAKRKPIMIGEYGATHFSALENKSTTDFAIKSINNMYLSLPYRFPRVKCINYFNTNNLTLEHRKNNNYAVTQNAEILDLYRRIIAKPYFLPTAASADGTMADLSVAIPVSGTYDPDLYPLTPKPVTQKQIIKGTVRLSAWIDDNLSGVTMHFFIDGRKVHIGARRDTWQYPFDTTLFTNGRLQLELVAEQNGKILGRYPISVIIQN
jgi:hypothetical protein